MMQYIRFFVIGIILGIANVIPGISGGTLAVVCNIYDRLIGAITLNIKKLIKEFPFLLSVGIGLLCGIVMFSKVITFLFEHYPVPTNFFFIGIIAGSIPLIFKRVRHAETKKIPLSVIICIIAGFAVMVAMLVINPDAVSNTIQTQFSPMLAVKLFFAAAVAAIAMIIPGISGSLLMLLLGVYSTIIAAVAALNIPILIPVALGVLLGLLGGAGLVRFLLTKIPYQTYGAILGLVIGSVLVIFPGIAFGWTLFFSIISLCIGFTISFFFSREKQKV